MSITVSISAIQTDTPEVDADEMSNSRRSLVDTGLSGQQPPLLLKPHGSL